MWRHIEATRNSFVQLDATDAWCITTLWRESLPWVGAVHHCTRHIRFSLFKQLWYQLCLVNLSSGRPRPTLNFCTSRKISRNLCNRERRGFCTQDFFHHSFAVHGNELRHYIQSCELHNCVSTVFVLVFFSSVIYIKGMILCESSVRASWYVLSMLNCYIT